MKYEIKISKATNNSAREFIEGQGFPLSQSNAPDYAKSTAQVMRESLHMIIDSVPMETHEITIEGAGTINEDGTASCVLSFEVAKMAVAAPEEKKDETPAEQTPSTPDETPQTVNESTDGTASEPGQEQ